MEQKRFQSGREVMTQFIRGYEPVGRRPDVKYDRNSTILSGRRLAENLVGDLKTALSSLGKEPPSSGAGTP